MTNPLDEGAIPSTSSYHPENRSETGGVLISLELHRNQGTSTHSYANWLFDNEEFEVETYEYKNSRLILTDKE